MISAVFLNTRFLIRGRFPSVLPIYLLSPWFAVRAGKSIHVERVWVGVVQGTLLSVTMHC